MMENKKKGLSIAIDGYSSCGKSTIAKDLAKKLNYAYIDTGAMYRAITLYAMEHNLISGNEIDTKALEKHLPDIKVSFKFNLKTKVNETHLNDKNVETEIRRLDVSNKVSLISAIDFVRGRLVELQQQMAAEGRVVMDGRDIGTVVMPDADLKIFMTASPGIRAERRYKELKEKGEVVSLDEIIKNIEERDHLDTTREISPLRKADDAIILDNSNLTKEEQLNWIVKIVEDILK
jgi:cytidylate kinase